MSIRKLRAGIAFALILAFIVMLAIALYADLPRMAVALTKFRWIYLPLILGLTLFNYGGRFIKWQYYLRRLGVRLAWTSSLLIFLSGLSMAITPGKVGELLKPYLLKRTTGTTISRTTPILIGERMTDGIAMIILASLGLMLYRFGWEALLILLALSLVGIIVVQNRSLALKLLSASEHLPVISRITHHIRPFYESAYTLFQWRPLLLAVGIGIISWSGECVALYYVYMGLDIPGSADLLIKSALILVVSTLIGSATGLPGGLGTADGSMLGLSRLLVTASATLAGAATLLIRFCTLWFGVLIGIGSFLIFRARHPADIPDEQSLEWERSLADYTPSPVSASISGKESHEHRHILEKNLMKTLILIPTYNEIDNLGPLLKEIFSFAPETDVLVIDDNSPDGTGQFADQLHDENPHIHVIHRAGKLGLGTAYIAGFKYALEHGYDAAFEMDADFSHDPKYLPNFLKAIKHADLVIGSRYVPGGATPNWSAIRQFISGGGNIFARFMLGIPVHDCTAGYRCYRREVLENLALDTVQTQGYGFQVEMTYRVLKQGFKIVETPIVFMDRRVGKSKMSRTIFLEAFLYVIRTRFGKKPQLPAITPAEKIFSSVQEASPATRQ